ncbi:MAG: hypothetical protein F6K28_32895 [Microcoleus sp. SIO2G3]|nr:hypothetical protein [Microcoleus sp. SIO2G3]
MPDCAASFSFNVSSIGGAPGTGKSLLRSIARWNVVQMGRICFAEKLLSEWSMPLYRSQAVYFALASSFAKGTAEENVQAVYKL